MTVEELIEELKRQPNQRVNVEVLLRKDGEWYRRVVDTARWDGGSVLLEIKR